MFALRKSLSIVAKRSPLLGQTTTRTAASIGWSSPDAEQRIPAVVVVVPPNQSLLWNACVQFYCNNPLGWFDRRSLITDDNNNDDDASLCLEDESSSDGIYLISTLKRRRKMMNKHKLRKRRKKNRMKNKK